MFFNINVLMESEVTDLLDVAVFKYVFFIVRQLKFLSYC